MRDSRAERSFPQLEAAHKPDADIACGTVPLHDNQLEDIAFHLSHYSARLNSREFKLLPCHNLVGHNLDHANLSCMIEEDLEILSRAITQVHRASRRWHGRSRQRQVFSIFSYQHSFLISLANPKLLKIVKHDEIGPVPRG